MWSVRFWKATAERVLKSGAQALVLYWGGGQFFNAWDADWTMGGKIALGAMVLSGLTSVGSAFVGDSASPSLVSGDR